MRLRHILGLLALNLSASALSSDIDKSPELAEEADLICHTSDLSECYPKVFVPTNKFQIVHKDQAVPAGLHIRMDMQTGEKEAKFVDPADDEPVNAVEVIPNESVKDEVPQGIKSDLNAEDQMAQILDGMRQAKQGKAPAVRPPVGAIDDRAGFNKNVDIVLEQVGTGRGTTESERAPLSHDAEMEVTQALNELEELCHDIYWGQELTKVILGTAKNMYSRGSMELVSHFSRLLATATQNNAAALEWYHVLAESDGASDGPRADMLRMSLDFIARPGHDERTLPRAISHVSSILADERSFRDFLHSNGAQIVREALESMLVEHANATRVTEGVTLPKEEQRLSDEYKPYDRVRQKAADLLWDAYFSDDGQERLNRWGHELERYVDSFDRERVGEMNVHLWNDLETLCTRFGQMVKVWSWLTLAAARGGDPTPLSDAEPRLCGASRKARLLRQVFEEKSEL